MEIEELMRLHNSLCDRAYTIMKAKNKDYTAGGGVFANFDLSASLGVPRELGLLVRVSDKVIRLKSGITGGALAVKGEGFEDTILDVINYMVLLAGMSKEARTDEKDLDLEGPGVPRSGVD
ncbi:MAG: hypothetical protein ACREBU_01555 [Nitrososphaera sp.]